MGSVKEMTIPAQDQGKVVEKQGSALGKWIILSVFALAIAAFFYFDLGRYVTLASLKENKDALKSFTETHYGSTVILYILIYCIQTAFSLPGAAILTLGGGFLFGSLLGTVYVNIAATSGATLAFLAARYLFRDTVENKFGKKLESIQMGFANNAFNYLLTLRLIPLFPFFLVNLASGLTRMRLSTYVLATAIGIIPGSFVFSNAGKQLGNINSVKDVASPMVLEAFALLGVLALVPVVYQKLKLRKRSVA
jgi:uncharacterized membrane protein YdjX (TVP38/TMEM64 family)